MDVFGIIMMLLLGLLIGSFSNVLIWRLPRGENVAFPPSHCPHCGHALSARDLVPVFSWLLLRGKCRYCHAPISARYPLIELLTGCAYALIAVFFPLSSAGAGLIGLGLFFTILLAASLIDAETYTIPDALTLPGVALGLLFAALHKPDAAIALPTLPEAARGALMGAGLLVVIDLLGSWVLRRFRERQYPEQPLGYQQIALGMLAGLGAGALGLSWTLAALIALLLALASTLLNAAAKRPVRVPEALTLGLSLLGVASSSALGAGALLGGLQGALCSAGAVSLLAGAYWWLRASDLDDAPADPSAMGFGDVKLAAVIGSFLGFNGVLLAVVVAVVSGAVLGVAQRLLGGENRLKFGPYLALGALVSLLWGDTIVQSYKHLLGLP